MYKFKQLGLAVVVGLVSLGNNVWAAAPTYPIDSTVTTTLERTVIPVPVPQKAPKLLPTQFSEYTKNGYGLSSFGDGLKYDKRLDLMPVGYKGADNVSSLLNFFAMTDVHITDKESPAQSLYLGYKGGIISAYSPTMLYTTQMLDAAVQTVNALHEKKKFNFGISLGDNCNNNQLNELRWFIDVFDGKKINPDSGKKDYNIRIKNDYQAKYQAAGLNSEIPWYQTIGNHDHFWLGVYPSVNKTSGTYIRDTYTGNQIIKMGNKLNLHNPVGIHNTYMGVIDGKTEFGEVIGTGPVDSTANLKIVSDVNRRSLSRNEWMKEFLKSDSKPKGHGFTKENVNTGFACYSFKPKSDLPIKVIVLDDTQGDTEDNGSIYVFGSLDQKRYDWLKKELKDGQDNKELMIIAAHVPIDVDMQGMPGWSPTSFVNQNDLITELHKYPNLILWIAGHRHVNTVTAIKDTKINPANNFWQVETASLREFPQQFRTFEIVRNSDNNISILTTDVDPAVKKGSLVEKSREAAIGAMQIFAPTPISAQSSNPIAMKSCSYNAELVKQLTPEMQEIIKNIGTPILK
ncbi:MAG: TIGR03768 family metallophosphoesterase [Candidatus Gastranaerophilaceae bacterium]|jgi:metallophosphoesterase (TIGR03768 family)